MSEELAVLLEVAQRLQRAAIPYMITGSVAVSFYAVPRMTRDIDIVAEVSESDLERICELFASDFYLDREAIQDAIAGQGMFNIIHQAHVVKVDFIVRKAEPYRQEEFRRRRTAAVQGVELVVVAPEDLVLSKLVWAKGSRSQMHLEDVRNILEGVPLLDYGYLERWAAHLRVTELLREVRG